MYHLVFYFFYRTLATNDPGQKKFVAIALTFMVILLHISVILKLMVFFGIINNFPIFSSTYLYNKLSWYPILILLIILMLLYFNKKRTTKIINEKFGHRPFFTLRNIFLVCVIIGVPILILIIFPSTKSSG